MAHVAHQADRLAQDPRECLDDLYRRAEAVYQSAIAIAIFVEGLLPSLEQFKNGLGRIRLFERGSKGILREVYSGYFGVVHQGGIDDQLEVRSGGCFLSSRRHEDNGLFTFVRAEGMD
jgi:hypothetical protein